MTRPAAHRSSLEHCFGCGLPAALGLGLAAVALALGGCLSARAESPATVAGDVMPASAPATAAASQPAVDPFSRLRITQPIEQLPPLRSVRIRDQRETRRSRVRVLVRTSPSDAKVLHGGRLLGNTPLTLTVEGDTTPLDIVVLKPRHMTLRTRIMRDKSRTYLFRLHPAKL